MSTLPSGNLLRIATRKSPLALWQAEHIKTRLNQHHPELEIQLVTFTTQGDKILDTPLAKVGGKGLFVKELEMAMLEGRADIAVHSMKDVPMEFPDGLTLPVICEREDPRDALVSNRFDSLDALPAGGRVGTSSLRRQCQLRRRYPHLDIVDLRGNVNTRLAKLDAGDYDAIMLATAGLVRLGMEDRITRSIAPEDSLPAAGQGAIGIECRADDAATRALIEPLRHRATSIQVTAERAMNRHLQGGCQVPIGCYAVSEGDQLWVRGLVGSPDGASMLFDEVRGDEVNAEQLGVALADKLLSRGAGGILTALYGDQE